MAKEGVTKPELLATLGRLEERQTITLVEDDTDNSHACEARNVSVQYGGQSEYSQASHYVTTKTCVDYKWERGVVGGSASTGRLVAVHSGGRVFAHVIQSKHSGKVRVTVDESREGRCLLRDCTGAVVDVDFARVADVVLACMEDTATCFVYSIHTELPVSGTLILQMRMNEVPLLAPVHCRAIWCVHVAESGAAAVWGSGSEACTQLVVTCGGRAVVVSVPVVARAVHPATVVQLGQAGLPGVMSTSTGAQIWDAKMSPDGIVLCVARQDGNVHFYQCDLKKGEQDALMVYTWVPHDGQPVHSVNFFDDVSPHTTQQQFWMFALSGAEGGRQFRLWNCQHWHCMQTIDMLPAPHRPLPCLQPALDPRGGYVLLADSLQKVLLLLRVDRDLLNRHALVRSVNEFRVGSPILSFAVVDLDYIRPIVEGAESGFRARLLTVHSNTLQHMDVTFVGEQVGEQKENQCVTPSREEEQQQGDKQKSASTTPNRVHSTGKLNGDTKKPRKKKADRKQRDSPNEETGPVELHKGDAHSPCVSPSLVPRPGCVSPSFVLQPPSAFDAVLTLRNCHTTQHGPAEADHPTPTSLLKRDERSTASNLGSFGLPPVDEPLLSALNGADRDSRGSSYNNLASAEKRLPWGGGMRDYDQEEARLAAADPLGLAGRMTRLETTLSAVATVIDHQSKVLDSLTLTLEELKRAKHAGPDKLDGQSVDPRMAALPDAVAKEVKAHLAKSLKPVGDRLATDVQAHLGALEAGLKARVDDTLKGRQFAQGMAGPVTEAVKKTVQEVVATQLTTGFQTTLNSALVVLTQTFSNGTKDYLKEVNRTMDTHFSRLEACLDERVSRVEHACTHACTQAIQAGTAQLAHHSQAVVQHSVDSLVSQIMPTLASQLATKLTTTLREELREHQGVMHESLVQAVRSGIATPGGANLSKHQTLTEVKSALAKADYNTAFRLALSASDLSVVLFVCEKVNVKEVFGDSEVLQMPVLFSLIQQLAVDVGVKTDLKLNYLQEALLAIQPDHLDTASFKFLRTVLADVTKALNKFLQTNPTHALSRTIRMVAHNATLQLSAITAIHAGKD